MPRRAKKIGWTHWTNGTFAANAFSAGTAAVTVAAALHEPETILRMRGEYVAYADATQAPGALVRCTQGMILVPEGTGTTVLWSPFTDGDAPWIWWDSAIIGYEEMVTDVVDVPMLSGVRRIIDSKAMRISRNQELQWVVEQSSLLLAMSLNVSGQVRILTGHA